MADVIVTVKSVDQGSRNIQQFGASLDGLVGKALKVGAAIGGVSLALAGVQRAAQAAWDFLGDGAALELANSRFENLAASIGTTAAALKGDMAEATGGMMSNAQMVASASDIISLGLADTSDGVVRLSSLVGKLGWDMNVLTLTMANDSMLRLDSLGLSMTDVKERMQALRAEGMEMTDAFDLAVIEAGEAKVKLLGDAAETSAGKMQRAEVAIANYTDSLKLQAVHLAENIGLIDALATKASQMNLFIEASDKLEEALSAGAIDQGEWGRYNDMIRRGGIEDIEKVIHDLDRALRANGVSWKSWATATSINMRESENLQRALEPLPPLLIDLVRAAESADAAMLNSAAAWREARDAAAEFNDKSAEMETNMEKLGNLAMRNQGEHARQAAEEMAQAYEDAALRMGQAFSAALQPEGGFDFGDTGAMSDAAWSMAQAFGLTVEEMGNVGIALGEITPEMADAAAKAVLFQEAFGNLLGQLSAGNLDTSGFVAAYEALVNDLQEKSFVEIQVELKQKENPARELWAWLPQEERQAVEIPVTFTPEEAALNTALGMIDGIPDEQNKLITFNAEYTEVTPTATAAIETAIDAIDATVLMIPDATEVHNEIALLDESRLTVYVDFVQGATPETPGRAMGGPVTGGAAYWVGERGPEMFVPWTDGNIVPNNRVGGEISVSVQNIFYGQADAAEVERASEKAARRMMERLQQVASV